MVAQVFAARENGVQPIKTVVEKEADLMTYYKNKLKIDDFLIPDPFKIPHGWIEEDEGIAFWFPQCYQSQIYLFFDVLSQ